MSESDTTEYNLQEAWSQLARDVASGSRHYGDDRPFNYYRWEMFVRRFLRPLAVVDKAVLEVGCGPGGLLRTLLDDNPRRLVGCDIAPPMIELASRESQGLAIEYVLVDGTSLPFGDAEFDVAFTNTVLQQNPDRMLEATISEMCRVTKDFLCLIEETFPAPWENPAFFGRTPADYIRRVTAHGWRFVGAEVLPVIVSERVCNTLTRWLNKRGHRFGEAVTKADVLAERIALRLTRLMDRVVRRDYGMTKIAFRRERFSSTAALSS